MRGLTDPPRWLAPALERDADVSASVRAKAMFAHGYAALDHGDFARAEKSFEASATMYRELDEPRGIAACLAQLGILAVEPRGLRTRRRAGRGERRARASTSSDRHIESVALGTLAEDATRRGDLERAREMYEQSLELRRELGDRRNIANALLNVGRTELLRGDEEHAREMLDQGLAVGREVGDTWSIAVGLGSLGRLALREGRRAEAVGLLRQALELTVERGGKRLAAECLAALAEAASSDAPARAARLFGTAEALRRASGVVLSPVELAATRESLDGVRETLGEDEFAHAVRGRAGHGARRRCDVRPVRVVGGMRWRARVLRGLPSDSELDRKGPVVAHKREHARWMGLLMVVLAVAVTACGEDSEGGEAAVEPDRAEPEQSQTSEPSQTAAQPE